MGIKLLLLLVWAIVSAKLIWDNQDIIEKIPIWRGVVAVVILCAGAPVFFISDILEILLDIVTGEEEE